MFPIGALVLWAGYGISSWGWILVKGYNITLREWFTPLHPYEWPSGTPETVPVGSVFPTSKSKTAASSAADQPDMSNTGSSGTGVSLA